MKTNMTANKLAMTVLALSLTQAVSAADNSLEKEAENKSTYWGIGIGSVLGAVIAGPPGAAIGATLGGSIGWGKDSHEALNDSLNELEQQELAIEQSSVVLEKNRLSLEKTEREVLQLKRSNSQQALRLKELETAQSSHAADTEFLKNLADHYAQDIYFQSGQSATPDYAKARLASLVELLKSHPDLRVTLKGFTDSTGSPKLNAALAQARVDGIKEALKTQGIDETRITGLAIGEVDHDSKPSRSAVDIKPQESVIDSIQDSTSEDSEFVTEIADINSHNSNIKQELVTAKAKPHVLDRRVTIELSVQNSADESSIANLAALEK